ncbi:unnamed protein product [Prunus armeniaca]
MTLLSPMYSSGIQDRTKSRTARLRNMMRNNIEEGESTSGAKANFTTLVFFKHEDKTWLLTCLSGLH